MRDPAFLRKAKEQLDTDHFGLDQVKRRLVEYLAVVRCVCFVLSLSLCILTNIPLITG